MGISTDMPLCVIEVERPAFGRFENSVCDIRQQPHWLLPELISWDRRIVGWRFRTAVWYLSRCLCVKTRSTFPNPRHHIHTHIPMHAHTHQIRTSPRIRIHIYTDTDTPLTLPVRRTASSEDKKRTLSHSASLLRSSFNVYETHMGW